MRGFKRTLAGLATAVGLVFGMGQAQAAIIPIELVLAIDASGSISAANYALQRDAYESVLSSSLIPTDGTMAIGVIEFGGNVQEVFALTVIDSQATKDLLIAAIQGMNRNGINTGATAIGSAINVALGMLAGLDFANDNQVIDVSTDGANNAGDNLAAAIAAATAADTDVNCLGVGAGANCSFATGFSVLVDDFDGFEAALEQKIAQETGQRVPEPMTAILLGLGLLGLGYARRRAA